jgi:histidine triad (HIT) family protein
MDNCIFCKIARKEIAKDFTYEDEFVMVFPDIHPFKKVHLLVVPKEHVKEFALLTDDTLLCKIKIVIQKVIKEKGLESNGYRLIINGGGAQAIDHLHVHVTGPWGKDAAL